MLASLMCLGRVMAMMLVAEACLASAGEASHEQGETKQFQAEPTRTGKERLGGKASDEQRVDNCNVPPDLRGPKPRSDDCGDGPSTRSKR
jgi:hypothetical protein